MWKGLSETKDEGSGLFQEIWTFDVICPHFWPLCKRERRRPGEWLDITIERFFFFKAAKKRCISNPALCQSLFRDVIFLIFLSLFGSYTDPNNLLFPSIARFSFFRIFSPCFFFLRSGLTGYLKKTFNEYSQSFCKKEISVKRQIFVNVHFDFGKFGSRRKQLISLSVQVEL